VRQRSRILIGTSGWHYPHWVGPFYPEHMRPAEFLPHYARFFTTTEINNTFYRLPTTQTLASWRDATPPGFVFACKASRHITHMKKLRNPEASVQRFFQTIEALGDKLGPILFQLPPRWRVDLDRLAAFLEALPSGGRYAFEFRDESWFTPAVYKLLESRNVALCIYELDRRRSPREVTADFIYLRLHGPGGPYQGSYDDGALADWTEWLLTWRKAGVDVYVYFDNDEKGHAVRDARRLGAMVEGRKESASVR